MAVTDFTGDGMSSEADGLGRQREDAQHSHLPRTAHSLSSPALLQALSHSTAQLLSAQRSRADCGGWVQARRLVPALRSSLLNNNTEGILCLVKSIGEYAKLHDETIDPMVEEGAVQTLSNVLEAKHPPDMMYVPPSPSSYKCSAAN